MSDQFAPIRFRYSSDRYKSVNHFTVDEILSTCAIPSDGVVELLDPRLALLPRSTPQAKALVNLVMQSAWQPSGMLSWG